MEGSARGDRLADDELRHRLELLADPLLATAAGTWAQVGEGLELIEASFHIAHSQASRAAWALYDLDREARRAVHVMAGLAPIPTTSEVEIGLLRVIEAARTATPRQLVRPAEIDHGGFHIRHAEPGSTTFILEAYGLLAVVLLSDPVQFVLTLQSIIGTATRVLMRIRGRDRETATRDLTHEFHVDGSDVNVGGSLPPGSTFRLRYKSVDGTELELDVETPG